MIRNKEIIEQVELEIIKPKGKKHTILVVMDEMITLGGLETYTYSLCKELAKREHKVILSCSKISPTMGTLFSFIDIFHDLPVEKICALLQEKKVNLIHCHPFGSAKIALELHQKTKVPFVITWHGAYYTDDFPQIVQKTEKVICVSQEAQDILLKKYPLAKQKTIIIQNGVDTTDFKPEVSKETLNEITLIARGNIDRLAGLKYLINSFLQSSFHRLNILGFNNEAKIIQDIRLNFVGEVSNVKDYITNADLVVATGRGVREALACGKPCIVMSNWGYDGIVSPATLKEMEYANFSGRGIGEPLMEEKITADLNLLMSEELRRTLGNYGRHLAENLYDIKSLTDKLEIAYLQAIENSKLPKVSIVLPVYNHADMVGPCLSSLLNQTYQDFEIVLVNDGSTDGLVEALLSFTDKRIRCFHFSKNKGLPKALNQGLRLSRGKYLTWTSADNLHLPTYLEKLVEVLERESACGSVYSDYIQIDENGNFIKNMSKGIYRLNGKVNYGPSFLYKSETANQVGFFDETLFGTEDRDYSIRMAAAAPVFWFPQVLYEYRMHDQSLTGKYIKKKLDLTQSLQRISSKWKWLLLSPEVEPTPIDRKKIVYGQKLMVKPMADCTVNSNINENLDADPIFLGKFHSVIYRYFVKFSLCSLPKDILVFRAVLQFFCIRNDNKVKQKIGAHQVNEMWNEHTIHWSNKPSIADEPVAAENIDDVYQWVSFDITGLVQKWLAGITPNNGICLKLTDELHGQLLSGYNRHYFNEKALPRLVIEFTGKSRCLTC
ncbi:MAG: glycosyltransferase [Clostridia bacterium]|nr:glycosyltransferase [Clostridia bacterium]